MMIILSKYDIDQVSRQVSYIRCKEHASCPCCGWQLKIIGSRKRKYINKTGEKVTLIIRRLRCSNCKRVHHELPDILVPYKRYGSSSIENVLTDLDNSTVPAEESTIYRWKRWFNHLTIRILTYLLSIPSRSKMKYRASNDSISMSFLKSHPKWLAIVVRQLVSINMW
jgi:hypothetical protein